MPMTPALSVYLVMAETCYEGSTLSQRMRPKRTR